MAPAGLRKVENNITFDGVRSVFEEVRKVQAIGGCKPGKNDLSSKQGFLEFEISELFWL